jgi:hypothetical protein
MRRNALLSSVLTLLVLILTSVYLFLDTAAEDRRPCHVEPRSQAELQALAGRPVDTLIIPASQPQPAPWTRADANWDTNDEPPIAPFLATVHEANACAEAYDNQRLYALYSGDFLRRTLRSNAVAEDWEGLPAIPVWRGTWQLKNGRIGVVFSEPATSDAPPVRQPVYFVFVWNGDRWLIDDAIPFAPDESTETMS